MDDKDIEKIFGSSFDENTQEIIKKIENYGAKYDPDSELSAFDQLQICESRAETENEERIKEKVRFKVKGNQGSMVSNVSSTSSNDIIPTKKKASNDLIAYLLAQKLDDLDNLPYYEKLIRERRSDFLKNCLVITLIAYQQGKITKTKAAYFTGVVKQKTALQKRIKKYKEKHTT